MQRKPTYPDSSEAEYIHETNDSGRGAYPVPRRRGRLQRLRDHTIGIDVAMSSIWGGFSESGGELDQKITYPGPSARASRILLPGVHNMNLRSSMSLEAQIPHTGAPLPCGSLFERSLSNIFVPMLPEMI